MEAGEIEALNPAYNSADRRNQIGGNFWKF